MGFFKIKQGLAVGGSVAIGADCGLYRDTTNRLKTDDALVIAGTADLRDSLRVRGSAVFSGTPFIVPYAAAAQNLTQNGEIKVYDPVGAGKMSVRTGGTIYTLAFPAATHGTLTITVGTPT